MPHKTLLKPPLSTRFYKQKLDKLQRWANKYDSTPEKVLEDMKGYKLDRYKDVNLTNADTIEFRLFRGTLNINTFILSDCLNHIHYG